MSSALNPNNNSRTKRTAWFISCVSEAIIQTLEDVSVNVSLPKNEQVKKTNIPVPNSTNFFYFDSNLLFDSNQLFITETYIYNIALTQIFIYYSKEIFPFFFELTILST